LAESHWGKIQEAALQIWPEAVLPPKNDICYATTNRQAAVAKMIEEGVEVVLVVTSSSSSNGTRLVEVANNLGATAYLVEDPIQIPDSVRGMCVGLTAALRLLEDIFLRYCPI
jgi:4-hydroxy-3-methylbut-2-enyl diphosphate reductase